ncbi:MAG: calcium/proton exchanger [Pseudomonadota bacterium]
MSPPAQRKPASRRAPFALLLIVPVAPLLGYLLNAPQIWVFLAGAVAIAVLADWIRRATEQLATRVGPTVGGLVNISFGSLAELVLALFVLVDGRPDVVRAQITGSIMGTSLLGLGIAIVVGCFGRERLTFKRERASLLATLLILAVIALLLPAVFDLTRHSLGLEQRLLLSEEQLSLGVAAILLLLYAGNLVYTLMTHRDVFAADEPRSSDENPWPLKLSLFVLVMATAAVAVESELVAGALMDSSAALGMSPVFLGVVVLALVGTASDLFAAAWFARQGKMGLALTMCVGSAIQIALVVAPLLVVASWLLGHPMSLVFSNPLDLFAIAATAFIVNAITSDGEATWFEGMMLIGVYGLLALAFFLIPAA